MALCAKCVDLTRRTRVYRHNPVQYVRRTPGLVGLSMVIPRHLGSDCKPGRPSPSREQDETAQASANYNVYRIRLRAPVPDIGDAIAQHSYAAAIYSPGALWATPSISNSRAVSCAGSVQYQCVFQAGADVNRPLASRIRSVVLPTIWGRNSHLRPEDAGYRLGAHAIETGRLSTWCTGVRFATPYCWETYLAMIPHGFPCQAVNKRPGDGR
jgi:hypothetical protein